MHKNGLYICVEGCDYSGKSTVVNLLHNYLKESQNINSVVTKHPGATWIGQKIREVVKDPESNILDHTRAMLFAVDNAAFHEEIAKPMIGKPDWVLADRNNFVSALAYQIADGVSLDEIKQIHSSLLNPRKINHVFILDINYETRMTRFNYRLAKEGKTSDYYERDRTHFDKLRNAYLGLPETDALRPYVEQIDGNMNIHIIDGNVDAEGILEQATDILMCP